MTIEKQLATANAFLQLLQVEKVVMQLVFQTAIGSSGFAFLMLPSEFFFFFKLAQSTPLNFTAQVDDLVELEVARLNFEKSRPGCEKQGLGFEELVFRFLQSKIEGREIG